MKALNVFKYFMVCFSVLFHVKTRIDTDQYFYFFRRTLAFYEPDLIPPALGMSRASPLPHTLLARSSLKPASFPLRAAFSYTPPAFRPPPMTHRPLLKRRDNGAYITARSLVLRL